jgi:hypothetical protein
MTALKYKGLIVTIVTVLLAALLIAGGRQALTEEGTCEPTVWSLTAGQDIVVGTVTVENDDLNLYIRYQLDQLEYPNASFGALHVWVGDNLNKLPRSGNKNGPGAPIPGKFPFTTEKCSPDPTDEGCIFDDETNTFTIPFSAINVEGLPDEDGCQPLTLFVVTHAEVTIDNGNGTVPETAFGGDTPGNGNRWWFYGEYVICCEGEPPGPEPCFTETAFAKGSEVETYVWTTFKKSNPEKLPSLELTKNRWGWAIKLPVLTEEGPVVITYDIWAGAGLNNTDNGELVGILIVNRAEGTARYELDPGYVLEEVHLYVSHEAPTTVAPGQYGYPTDGYDVGGVQEFTVEGLPLEGDVWLIGHAVVSTGQCE